MLKMIWSLTLIFLIFQLESCFGNLKLNTCCDHGKKNCEFTPGITIPGELMESELITTFDLNPHFLKCKDKDQIRAKVNLTNLEHVQTTKILKNHYLQYDYEFYPPDQFCIENYDENLINIKICRPKCSGNEPCIRKCCPLGKVFRFSQYGRPIQGCFEPTVISNNSEDKIWKPLFYKKFGIKLSKPDAKKIKIHYISAYPREKNFANLKRPLAAVSHDTLNFLQKTERVNNTISGLKFHITKDGRVWTKDINDGRCREIEKDFCIDGITFNYGDADVIYFNGSSDFETMIIYQGVKNIDVVGARDIYPIPLIISSVFLLLTIIVYAILWEYQAIKGWIIMSLCSTMFIFYIIYAIIHLINYVEYLNTFTCIFVAYLGHIAILSNFLWLTIFCFALWLVFHSMKPVNKNSKGFKRYLVYACIAWVLPFIFVTTLLIIDRIYGNPDLSEDSPCLEQSKYPAYGRLNCSINPDTQGIYLYYIIAILIILNFAFFIATIRKLMEYQKSTKFARENIEQKKSIFLVLNSISRLKVYCKLFAVMGVIWIFEVISWYFEDQTQSVQGLWVAFDLLNILQPVAIFLNFVIFNFENYTLMGKKFPQHQNLIKKIQDALFCKSQEYQNPSTETKQSALTSKSDNESEFSSVENKNNFRLKEKNQF